MLLRGSLGERTLKEIANPHLTANKIKTFFENIYMGIN